MITVALMPESTNKVDKTVLKYFSLNQFCWDNSNSEIDVFNSFILS